jgi:hypothetical protein
MFPGRPISALLSQVLIAFTVEFDNEFERRIGEAGHPGARLSLVVWTTLMRFIADSPLSVRDLAAKAREPEAQIKFKLGCLERWGFIKLNHRELRADGWGSGRGIRADWTVHLTTRGIIAAGRNVLAKKRSTNCGKISRGRCPFRSISNCKNLSSNSIVNRPRPCY